MQKLENENKLVKPVHRVVLAGGRGFTDYDLFRTSCLSFIGNKLTSHQVIVVSGHAPGADSMGERFAQEYGLQIELHPADWAKHGRAAGPIRNREMAACSDALIAFWDGKSRGTKNMIGLARRYGLVVSIVSYN